jgi:hypothetical protein
MADDFDAVAAVNSYMAGAAPTPETTLRASLADAVGQNPDQVAQWRRTAATIGVPIDTAQAMPDFSKQQAALAAIDTGALARMTPVTAGFLMDPTNAAISHDDTGNLSGIETAIRAIGSAAQYATSANGKGLLYDVGNSYIFGSAKAGALSLLGVGGQLTQELGSQLGIGVSDSDAARLFKDDPAALARFRENSSLSKFTHAMSQGSTAAMDDIGPAAKQAYSGLEYATTDPSKAAYLSPVRMVGDALQSLPTSLALGLSAYLTKGAAASAETSALAAGMSAVDARIAGIAAAGRTMSQVGAGSEGVIGYSQQYTQTYDDVSKLADAKLQASPTYQALIASGYTPDAARIETAHQTAQESGIMAGIVDASVNAVGGEFLGKIIGEGGKLGARAAKGFATEGTTEFLQSGGEQLGQNVATQKNIDPNQDLSQGVGENMVQGLVVGGLTGGVMTSLAGQHAAAEQAESAAVNIEQLQKLAEASKLRARDPATFQAFINQVADGGETPSELYINPETLANTLNQSGITMAELQALAPSVATQMQAENYVPGADLRIPVSELLAAPSDITTQLIDHLRESPDAMSRAEAKTYLNQQGDSIRQEVEQELSRADGRAALQEQTNTLTDHFQAQLDAAGKFRPEVNKAYAALLGNFYATQAQRASMTPQDFMQRYQLGVSSQDVAGSGWSKMRRWRLVNRSPATQSRTPPATNPRALLHRPSQD